MVANYCEDILMSSSCCCGGGSGSSSFSVDLIQRQERTLVHSLQTTHEVFFINMPCAWVQLQMEKGADDKQLQGRILDYTLRWSVIKINTSVCY